MSEITDKELMRSYVLQKDEGAFTELVRRHLPLVYSAAARRLSQDPSAAEDVAQSVFVQLAQNGKDLLDHPVLPGWLYVTATQKAAGHHRQLIRRQRRETMPTIHETSGVAEPVWSDLKAILDAALLELGEEDRNALILRFFENRDLASVGGLLGLNADAARMRVSRGLEKLRAILKKRGVSSSILTLEVLLLEGSIEAAPVALATSIARAVRTAPPPELSAPLPTALAKFLSAAAVLLLVTAIGTVAVRTLRRSPAENRTNSATLEGGATMRGPGDPIRYLRGRVGIRKTGDPVDPKVSQALGYLRSALFDTQLSRAERVRLLEHSSQMLVGFEGESIPLLREALLSADPDVIELALEGLGRFGPVSREFGSELQTLLENPQMKDESGLIANRLLSSIQVMDSPVATLLAILQRRPDLSSPVQYLLTGVIGSNKTPLSANRELVEALLVHPNAEVQEAAKVILGELPEPPPQPTPEVSTRLTAGLTSTDPGERQKALLQTTRMATATPEMIQALVVMHQQDPSLAIRVDTRIELERLAPNDPSIAIPPSAEREANTRELLSKLDRQEATVSEMLTALADQSAEPKAVLERLPTLGSQYWENHGEEKAITVQVLASLHRERDAQVYETLTDVYAQVNNVPRTTYRIDQLASYFAAMESALTPGEYAIAMRDLKPSLDSYWQARGFVQPEPTHLPAHLIQTLLVGPYHQNRPAYEQMLRAIRQIDPGFQPQQP